MLLDLLRNCWPYLFVGVELILDVCVTIHAVLYKRDTRAVIGWVGLAWLTPMVGALAYFLLGVNRIQRKAVSLKIGEGLPLMVPVIEEEDYRIREELLEKHPSLLGLENLGREVTGKALLPGNTVKLLLDGDEAFPAMLEAIERAETSVALLSYIFDSDRAGDKFLEALKAAQRRGVEVRVLIDHFGSRYSKPNMVGRLRREGINVAAFLETRSPFSMNYANLRNHRKILVIDGRTGFTGGTNIREGHWLGLNPSHPVQCAHFCLEGPVVAHLQEVFAIDWAFASGESLQGGLWFPEIERTGWVGARGIPDGPDEDFEHVSEVMLGALATATKNVRVTSPYFLPDAPMVRALNGAAMRGVAVDIVLPSKNNIPLVQWATMPQLEFLLEKGCRVHFSAPPFDHTKLMVIDGVWSLIGSTNWDPRSLRLNFEFNVECYDTELAEQLEALIDKKIVGGTPVTIEKIQTRSFPVKIRDGLARLASPYL